MLHLPGLQVLGELRRLMPGKDPVAVLLADPSGCLDMQVKGQRGIGCLAGLDLQGGVSARLPHCCSLAC